MAIEKDVTTPFGVVCTYWKITSMHIDWHKRCADITLAGWLSEETRRTDKQALKRFVYTWESTAFPFEAAKATDIVSVAYLKLKELPLWADGKPVLEAGQAIAKL